MNEKIPWMKDMDEEDKNFHIQNLRADERILLKIANGIGNTECGYSILDFARIGGCNADEMMILEKFFSSIPSADENNKER